MKSGRELSAMCLRAGTAEISVAVEISFWPMPPRRRRGCDRGGEPRLGLAFSFLEEVGASSCTAYVSTGLFAMSSGSFRWGYTDDAARAHEVGERRGAQLADMIHAGTRVTWMEGEHMQVRTISFVCWSKNSDVEGALGNSNDVRICVSGVVLNACSMSRTESGTR